MTSNDSKLNSLDKYLDSSSKSEEISKEINLMEDKLSLFNYPSFKEIFTSISTKNDLNQHLLSNLNSIIISKQIDDEKRVELISNQTKINEVKYALQQDLSKHKKLLDNLKVKYDKLLYDQTILSKKVKEMDSVIKSEKEQATLSLTKFSNKETQSMFELKKKDVLISRLMEQIGRLSDTTSKINTCPIAKNSEMYISYGLNEKKANVNIGNKNPKEFFNEEMSRALSEKYQMIIRQNEYMKAAFDKLNKEIIDLTLNQRNNFYNVYKETFDSDFNAGNIDMTVNNQFDLNDETEKFIDQIKYLMVKLKEFVIRKDELWHNGGGFNIRTSTNSDSNTEEINGNISCGKRGNIDQSYLINMIQIKDYYKELSNEMTELLQKVVLKDKQNDNKRSDVPISDIQDKRKTALNSVINVIDDNKTIDNQRYNNDKGINTQKKTINYDQMKNELQNYIEILNTTEAYALNKIQTENQIQSKDQSVDTSLSRNNDDNVLMS